MGSYKLEQACTISEMAYVYEAYKLEQACTISEMAYLYEDYKIRTTRKTGGLLWPYKGLSLVVAL